MTDRRQFLSLLGAAAVGLAGCSGSESTAPTATPTRKNSTASEQTDTPGTETGEQTVEQDLTGEELYFNWVHGGIYEDEEHEEILNTVQGTESNSISFQQINNALEQGDTRVEQVANAVENAAHQHTPTDPDDYENQHRHIMSAVHQTLEQREEDYEVYSMTDWGKSTAFPNNGIDYSKIWVENENGEYTDINAMLQTDQNYTTHIKGQKTQTDREEVLQMLRDPERFGTKPPHDYEDIENAIEYYSENRNRDYSDEDMEDINGSWIKRFNNYIMGDGISVPSSVDEWRQFHEGIEAGPEMFLGLNETYHNEGYDGEPAQFNVEDEVDGSVSMSDTPDGYNPEEDGVPGTPAA